jgi:vancomycin resistance protein YoaR
MAQQIGTLPGIRSVPQRRAARSGSWAVIPLAWVVALCLLFGVALWRYEALYAGRIHEGVRAAGIVVGGMTPEEAANELAAVLAPYTSGRVTLRAGERLWHPTLKELGLQVDTRAMVAEAMALGRDGSLLAQWQQRLALMQQGAEIAPLLGRDPVAIDAYLSRLAREVAREPRDAQLLIEGLTARALPDEPGRQLDVAQSAAIVTQALAQGTPGEITLALSERPATLVGAEKAAEQINSFLAAPLTLKLEVQEFQRTETGGVQPLMVTRQWTIDRARLAQVLRVDQGMRADGQREFRLHLDPAGLGVNLEQIASEIEREPRDGHFEYDPESDVLTPLIVSQDGLQLDVSAAHAAVETALAERRHEVMLPVTVIAPSVSTADMEKMNIHGLAAQGRSNYRTSPPNREVNVLETARRMHGVVIPPGGEFSFNKYLGWVVEATGYEEGYIIINNKTEVDVGGGVCQVSSTMFRAALNAGFPITERHAHAYRVPYYENDSRPGMDATVFSPWVDLKFKNDTNNYYLIQTGWNLRTKDLWVSFYGPDTGRKVQIIGPTIFKETPPGPTVYINTPSLPAGTLEQIDWSHPGAEVQVQRIVRDKVSGEVIFRDRFWSSFRPWSARFLRGTGG